MTYNDCFNLHKQQINDKICKLFNIKENPVAVILDGPNLRTSKTFISRIPDIKIYIVERDYKTHLIQKTNIKSNKCISLHMTLNNFSSNENLCSQINLIYADFMGTITGSDITGNYPLADIRNILINSKSNKIVLACTFNLRNRNALKTKNVPSYKLNKEKYLEPLFRSYQFSIKFNHEYKYKHHMITYFYILEKDLSIDPNNIEFVMDRGKYDGYPPEECEYYPPEN
jgi:hypothetical protein